MNTEIALFILRIISGVILLSIATVIFVFIWRDYSRTNHRIENTKRVHGKLMGIDDFDGNFLLTGTVYPLTALTSIGRSPTNSIPIDDNFASSEHALVALRNGQWWLEDRSSRNGTLLNGMQVTQPVIVTDGDIITIGKIALRIDLDSST